jgi:phospholipid/cholesterol/gamma-HCH transport system permease protein
MTAPARLPEPRRTPAHALADWLAGWWRVVHLGALTLALALSPASYRKGFRTSLARHVVLAVAPNLLGFAVLSALISLVLIRIVVVTAVSYGLSQYALEMVVRVLVMELIPLTAALYAALRCTIPNAVEMARMRSNGTLDALAAQGHDVLQRELLPRALAGMFAVVMMAALSAVMTLLLAYVSVYGFTVWGFDGYTRTVGRVFGPAVSLIFMLKIVLLSLAVSLIPLVTVVDGPIRRASARAGPEVAGLVRMLLAILVIEATALVGNYY